MLRIRLSKDLKTVSEESSLHGNGWESTIYCYFLCHVMIDKHEYIVLIILKDHICCTASSVHRPNTPFPAPKMLFPPRPFPPKVSDTWPKFSKKLAKSCAWIWACFWCWTFSAAFSILSSPPYKHMFYNNIIYNISDCGSSSLIK